MKKMFNYDDERLDNIAVHGGFTFFGKSHWDSNDTTSYLGWDYSHLGDYAGYFETYPSIFSVYESKKWTTSEIFEEVKSVINQFLEANAKEI